MYTLLVIANIIILLHLIVMFAIAMNSLQSDQFHATFTKVRIAAIMLTMITLIGFIT